MLGSSVRDAWKSAAAGTGGTRQAPGAGAGCIGEFLWVWGGGGVCVEGVGAALLDAAVGGRPQPGRVAGRTACPAQA